MFARLVRRLRLWLAPRPLPSQRPAPDDDIGAYI
jgi:hypothetical protein